MMRKFKHKTLWWVAECIETNERVCIWSWPMEWIWCSVHEITLLWFEEVVEQPPKRMRDVIEEYNKNYTNLNDHKLIKALEKHAPKQKKFTRDYVFNTWYKNKNMPNIWNDLLHLFLKEHWLLEE